LEKSIARLGDLVAIYRGLSVDGKASQRLFGRRYTKKIEAYVVAHNAREKFGVGAGAEVAVLVWGKTGGFNGFPGRNP
jgi:hypothetical protein